MISHLKQKPGKDTVGQLKQKLKKRIPLVSEGNPSSSLLPLLPSSLSFFASSFESTDHIKLDIELVFDGGKLFDEDTLDSLGIREGDTIHEDNGMIGLGEGEIVLT